MFPPNHPHYGTNRRRSRCPTGNKRIGLIAVIGICLFLCGFLVAFETTHDQHILKRINMQYIPMIPHPIYPHSDPKEVHLAVEDRRTLTSSTGNGREEIKFDKSSTGNKRKIELVDLYNQLVREITKPEEPLTEFLVKQFDEPDPLYQLVAQNAVDQGDQPVRNQVLPPKEAVAKVHEWVQKSTKGEKYRNQQKVKTLRDTTNAELLPQIVIKNMLSGRSAEQLTGAQLEADLEELLGLLKQLQTPWTKLHQKIFKFMREDIEESGYEVHDHPNHTDKVQARPEDSNHEAADGVETAKDTLT